MRHPLTVVLALLAFLIFSMGAAVGLGSERLGLGEVARVLMAPSKAEGTAARIVWDLRLPRAVLALLVGGGLSVVGVAMQALVRNPLAEPYVLGLSSGAAAGAALFYLGFLPPLLTGALSLPLAAFLGGLASITLVYLVARRGGGLDVTRLLLAGVAVASLMGAVTTFLTFAAPDADRLRTMLFLLLGSLGGTRWAEVPLPAAAALGALVTLVALARPLDALLVGEEPARSLGVSVEVLKRILLGLAALVTGVLVSVSGAIGFVGLIVPHVVRLLGVRTHRRLVPLAFVGGGLFLLWADVAARTLLPHQELHLGVLTALCGVPFFLFLLRRRGYRFG